MHVSYMYITGNFHSKKQHMNPKNITKLFCYS